MKTHSMTAAEFAEEYEAFLSLENAQADLAGALNLLGEDGRQSDGLTDNFNFYSACHVNRASDAFLLLRKADRIDAAKLLIRPAIEAIVRVLAVQKQPQLLLRIAYSEWIENGKWYRPTMRRLGKPYDEAAERKKWDSFKDAYISHFPEHPILEEKLTLMDAAIAAGPEAVGFYDSHYRLYCKFTHAAFEASVGELNDLTPADTRTMLLCTNYALEVVREIANRPPTRE